MLLTWEYYCSFSSSVMDEEEFFKREAQAEADLFNVIGLRLEEIKAMSEEEREQEFWIPHLKNCLCRIIEYRKNFKGGSGITSASNDGYSEAYANANQSAYDAELRSCIRSWLSGTGLVRAY